MNAIKTDTETKVEPKPATPPAPVVDRQALKELFWRKAPDLPELPLVRVRCDEQGKMWIIEQDGQEPRAVRQCVLAEVMFTSELVKNMIECCGHFRDGYIGWASGRLLPVDAPAEGTNNAGPVNFEVLDGNFYNRNGEIVKSIAWLALKQDCKALLIGRVETEK